MGDDNGAWLIVGLCAVGICVLTYNFGWHESRNALLRELKAAGIAVEPVKETWKVVKP